MIQRGRGGRWFDDKVLLPLPRMHYRLVTSTMPKEQERRIEDVVTRTHQQGVVPGLSAAARMQKAMASARQASLNVKKCVSIPALADLAAHEDEFQFGVKYIKDNKFWTTDRDRATNPYHRHLRALTDDCPKLRNIEAILNEQLARKNFRGWPAKGLIFTRYSETAMVIYKYLKSKLTAGRLSQSVTPELIYGDMPKQERHQITRAFKKADGVNIIVGVSSAMGTGLTLTRSQFAILVDQESDPGIHEQTICRTLRHTNWNWTGINVFELFCKGHDWEDMVRKRRIGREAFVKGAEIIGFERMADMLFRQSGPRTMRVPEDSEGEDMD